MVKYSTALLFLIVLASCAGTNSEGNGKESRDSIITETAREGSAPFFPSVVDSFEIVYYKKPFTDSTRYYRFFRFAKTTDSSVIKELNLVLAGTHEKFSEVKKCLSEGKFVMPMGGDAYKTIFFSRLETDCPYLYYIKDGAFYYYEMSPLLNEKLNFLEEKAIEPN